MLYICSKQGKIDKLWGRFIKHLLELSEAGVKVEYIRKGEVVLNGKPIGNRHAYDYFRKEGREELRLEVYAAFDRLSLRYNPVVMEGAGSLAEINLRDTDLVNMPMAMHAKADVILVGDIDRGGVFASIYGSLLLLTPEERKRVKGILINKFRGDIRLFESGVKMLEELCGIPVVGIVPYYKDIHIEEEDSVALAVKAVQAERGTVNVAVVLLRHLSNFTDFDVLERDPRVHLFYTNNVFFPSTRVSFSLQTGVSTPSARR